jgi:hypothetical protein
LRSSSCTSSAAARRSAWRDAAHPGDGGGGGGDWREGGAHDDDDDEHEHEREHEHEHELDGALGGGGGGASANGIDRRTRRGMRGRTCVGAPSRDRSRNARARAFRASGIRHGPAASELVGCLVITPQK